MQALRAAREEVAALQAHTNDQAQELAHAAHEHTASVTERDARIGELSHEAEGQKQRAEESEVGSTLYVDLLLLMRGYTCVRTQ